MLNATCQAHVLSVGLHAARRILPPLHTRILAETCGKPNFRNHLVNQWATLARGKTARDLILLEAILLPDTSVESGLDFLLGLAVALAPLV